MVHLHPTAVGLWCPPNRGAPTSSSSPSARLDQEGAARTRTWERLTGETRTERGRRRGRGRGRGREDVMTRERGRGEGTGTGLPLPTCSIRFEPLVAAGRYRSRRFCSR